MAGIRHIVNAHAALRRLMRAPSTDETLTIDPDPFLAISGAASFVIKNTAFSPTSMA